MKNQRLFTVLFVMMGFGIVLDHAFTQEQVDRLAQSCQSNATQTAWIDVDSSGDYRCYTHKKGAEIALLERSH